MRCPQCARENPAAARFGDGCEHTEEFATAIEHWLEQNVDLA